MTGKQLVASVVLPFAVLSGLALWWTRERPPRAGSPRRSAARPASTRARRPSRPCLPRAGPRPAPALAAPVDPLADQRLDRTEREDAEAAVARVAPLVAECFSDNQDRFPGPQTAELKFELAREGDRGVGRAVEIVSSSVRDPLLDACLEDAVTETRLPAPRSARPFTLRYPFRFEIRGKVRNPR